MLRQDKKLFCYFSGYTELSVSLHQHVFNTSTLLVTGNHNQTHQLKVGEHIQLDGVLFEVTASNHPLFSASTTIAMLENTKFEHVPFQGKLNLGILTMFDEMHDQCWMLQPSASYTVTYKGYSSLEDHTHTIKLNFEAPLKLAELITENQHLGLDGASLTAREVKKETNLLKFSIYAGRDTREKSRFNETLPLDTLVNFTAPAAIVKFSH